MSKLFYGVGINSKTKYKTRTEGGKPNPYRVWSNMLARCYSLKYHEGNPTYIGCSVDESWHDFQDFADWFYGHPYSDKDYYLDKDLLIPNNKIYSPSTCVFVPHELNTILVGHDAARGNHPQGVAAETRYGGFYAKMRKNSRTVNLGYFDCPQEAHQVYKKAKEDYVKEKALEWQDRIADDVFQALMSWQLTE